MTITNALKLNTHVRNICPKANSTLGFLESNMAACPQDVYESAYKGLVRPVPEYGSTAYFFKMKLRTTDSAAGNPICEQAVSQGEV